MYSGMPSPKFVDGLMEEFYRAAFGGFVRGIVMEEDGMDGFHAGAYNGCCVIGDGCVEAGGSGQAVTGNGVSQVAR